MDLQEQIGALFACQRQDWKNFGQAVTRMDDLRTKTFQWGSNFTVFVQLNPARLRSVTENGEKIDIKKRPCFLCETNRPVEQKGIAFLEKYIILCNPFPILRNHFTITLHSHVPQRIGRKINDMLTLTEQLPNYVVFYNGAKSGASAPDHFHFQAGLKLPVLMQGDNEFRSCMVIESEAKDEATELFEEAYRYLRHLQPDVEEEPMMNIIAFTENEKYRIHVFPRKAKRPKQYDMEGSKQLRITPGALDMAGLFTVVREEDFEKVTKQDIEDIYTQVSRLII